MKKSRLLIVLLIVAVVCLSLVACSEEHTHSYEWTIETAPTATTKGVATGKCSCGVTTAVALPVLTDTSVWTVDQAASTAATCQAEGSTVYTSVYGKVAVAEAKTEHEFGKFSITTTPTETVPGIAEKVCTVSGCGHKEQLELPVLTDSSFWTLTETAASHTQKGSKVYANASYELSVTIELAQIAHNFQKIADEKYLKSKATCESPATYYYSCECGAKSDETFTVGTANGHVYGSWALVGTPTSEAGAEATRKCLVCGKVETMSVPALTNTEFWTVNTVASTHKVKGSSTYTNSEYGFEVVVELALVPHTFDKKVESSEYLAHEADCTHAATYYYSCECGEAGESTFTVGEVQHQWGEEYSVVYEKIYDSEDWSAEPILEPTEYHARVCTVCGEVDKDNKEKHTYEVTEVITHADTLGNGTVQGYSVVGKQACSVCGYNNGEEKAYGYINIANPERSDYTLKTHVDATYEQAGYDEYVKKTDETFTVRIPIAKLVAPFENKSYSLINAYFNDDVQTRTASYTDYNSLTVAVDGKGEGSASMFPFNGSYKFTMVDAATGKISAELTRGSTKTVFEGYVSEIGVIVLTSDNYQNIYVLSPYGITTSDVKACRFAGTTLIYYHVECNTHIGHDYNIAIIGDEAHFDVAVTDFDGNNLPVSKVVVSNDSGYSVCNFVRITDAQGNKLGAFVKSGDVLVETDGLEGKYAVDLGEGQGTLALSGNGTFTFGSKSGTYTVAEGQAYSAELFVVEGGKNVAYYQLTIAEGVASVNKPMVTVTFEVGTYGEAIAPASVNAKVPAVLPQAKCNNEQFVFGGWYLDAACSEDQAVSEGFAPEQNVTVYAKWGAKVLVNVIDVQNPVGTVYIASGSALSVAIPEANEYTENQLSADGKFFFAGWFVDSNGNGVVDNEESEADLTAVVNHEDFPSGVTVIANWTAVPAYAGTYYGTQLTAAGSGGNSGGYHLVVDYLGNLKFYQINNGTPRYAYDGVVTSYNSETGELKWHQTKYNGKTDEADWTVFFNAEAKIFLGFDSKTTIGSSYYFFGTELGDSNGKVTSQVGIKTTLNGNKQYYHQLIKAKTVLGNETLVYTFNNAIYINVSIKNGLGEDLVPAYKGTGSVGDSSTVIVRDSEGTVLLALAAPEGATFNSAKWSDDNRALDEYFGTYTAGEGTLTLDGVGNASLTLGGTTQKGTYQLSEGTFVLKLYSKEVLVGYYTFTLDGENAILVKPETQLVFVTGEGHEAQATLTVNTNVPFALPVPANTETEVFMGWYLTDETQLIGSIVPTGESITLTAKWATKYVLTVVYGNGMANAEIAYGAGVVTAPLVPEMTNGLVFDHWYLSDDEGVTEKEVYVPSAINANVTIYCKWVNPPVFMQEYRVAQIYTSGSTSLSYSSSAVTFNEKGVGVYNTTSTYAPFYPNSTLTVSYINKTKGWVLIKEDYNYKDTSGWSSTQETGTRYFWGIIDPETGVILRSYTSYSEANAKAELEKESLNFGNSLYVMVPSTVTLTSSNFSGSMMSYDKYADPQHFGFVFKHNGEDYSVFTNGAHEVHFGVTFENESGEAVNADNLYNKTPYVAVKKDGAIIGEYKYTGSYMAALDGFQGQYNLEGGEVLTLDGLKTITIGENSGTYTAAAEGAGYTFEVFMTEGGKTVYYQLTVDKNAKTYTIVKPEVTLTFTSEYGTVEASVSVNTKVAYTLPAGLTDATHVFLGWYVTGDESQTIVTSVTPTEAMSFTAKWAEKVVLTIVYGNGLENGAFDYITGDTPNMDNHKIAWANNHLFEGWFTDETCTEAYTPAALTGNLTVYAKWSAEESDPYTVENEKKTDKILAWTQDGTTYTSANGGVSSSWSRMTITAIADITISFNYSVGSEANYDKLLVRVGAKSTLEASATGGSTELDVSGDAKTGSFTLTVKAGDTVMIEYKKDSSGDKNGDSVTLTDFAITVA